MMRFVLQLLLLVTLSSWTTTTTLTWTTMSGVQAFGMPIPTTTTRFHTIMTGRPIKTVPRFPMTSNSPIQKTYTTTMEMAITESSSSSSQDDDNDDTVTITAKNGGRMGYHHDANNKNNNNKNGLTRNRILTTMTKTLLSIVLLAPNMVGAAGPDWGLFEGRIGSLIHPTIMSSLFLYAIYTANLGFQWRRQRTIGNEITQLKQEEQEQQLAAQDNEEEEAPNTTMSAEVMATQQAIKALQQERKDLAATNPRDKHFAQGASLAFLGTAIAIEGCLNTYGRAGKLFPGPHLFVGAGLVVIWALSVFTIPAMQKGNDTARNVHIGANLAGLGLFAWQVQSGIPILLKVIEKTSWP